MQVIVRKKQVCTDDGDDNNDDSNIPIYDRNILAVV